MNRNVEKLKNSMPYVALILGLGIMLTFAIFAIMPHFIAPYDHKYSFDSYLPCSFEHLLGTNNLGYDIFSELVYATRSTLIVGVFAAVISLVIGMLIGLIAGSLSGIYNDAANGFINFFLLLPMLPVAIVLAAYMGGGMVNIIVVISLLAWCGTARAVRAKVLAVKSSPYIESCRVLGYGRAKITFRHILPNVLDVALSRFVTSVASCILLEATLSFLGLGFGTLSWGTIINYAYKFGGLTRGAYNWLLAPGVCIMLLELAFYLINYFLEFRLNAVKSGAKRIK